MRRAPNRALGRIIATVVLEGRSSIKDVLGKAKERKESGSRNGRAAQQLLVKRGGEEEKNEEGNKKRVRLKDSRRVSRIRLWVESLARNVARVRVLRLIKRRMIEQMERWKGDEALVEVVWKWVEMA